MSSDAALSEAVPPGAAAPPSDLRARNRDRNRAEVAAVALALFAENGFATVTVDDIAVAAGISRRTFFRYFESKEDALLPYETERVEQLRSALADRSPDEPILAAVQHATLELVARGAVLDQDDTLMRLRLVQENPSVRARALELQSRSEDEVRAIVAERLGDDPETSLTARVVAGAVVAAFRAATEVWLATDGESDLADLVGQAYAVLTSGLEVPASP